MLKNYKKIQGEGKAAPLALYTLQFQFFRDPIFLMYSVSNFLTSIGFNVPYVYTVVRRGLQSSGRHKIEKSVGEKYLVQPIFCV